MSSLSADKPRIIIGSPEIMDGESVEVSCTVPIDYTGGDCRLFRGDSDVPFRVMTAFSYVCVFNLSSQVLLGNKPVGSKILLRCDYALQSYVSVSSDECGVIVSGGRTRTSLA